CRAASRRNGSGAGGDESCVGAMRLGRGFCGVRRPLARRRSPQRAKTLSPAMLMRRAKPYYGAGDGVGDVASTAGDVVGAAACAPGDTAAPDIHAFYACCNLYSFWLCGSCCAACLWAWAH